MENATPMIDLPKVQREIVLSVRIIDNGKGIKVETTAQADAKDVRHKANSFGLIGTKVRERDCCEMENVN